MEHQHTNNTTDTSDSQQPQAAVDNTQPEVVGTSAEDSNQSTPKVADEGEVQKDSEREFNSVHTHSGLDKVLWDGNEYYSLFIQCPVCLEKGQTLPRERWQHDCGGEIFIGDNAYFVCKRCNETFHARNAIFQCPSHNSSTEESIVKCGSPPNIGEVVACAGMMISEAGTQWLIKFMNNLGD